MTTTASMRIRQPQVRKLGLDDGWWFFCPHFLNFGFPVVFVDACFVPELTDLGLEELGSRRPGTPFPSIDIRVRLLGNSVSLYLGEERQLVANHLFRAVTLPAVRSAPSELGIIVGDSYALQLSACALFNSFVGCSHQVESVVAEDLAISVKLLQQHCAD